MLAFAQDVFALMHDLADLVHSRNDFSFIIFNVSIFRVHVTLFIIVSLRILRAIRHFISV